MRRLAAVLLLLALAACAPLAQQAGRPELGFSGPRIEAADFVSTDGAHLPLTVWTPPDGREPWAVIVALHGVNSHAGAFKSAGPYWASQGVATYAYDQRGFGRGPHRGVWGGTALFIEDARTLTRLIKARYPHATIVLAGASLGGAVAIEAMTSSDPPPADRLLLLAPATWDKRLQPGAAIVAADVAAHTVRGLHIRLPPGLVNAHAPSDNTEEIAASQGDPLVIWSMRTDAIYGLSGIADHAAHDVAKLSVPTLWLYGANDHVISRPGTQRAVSRLPAGQRTAWYAEGWHWLLFDRQSKVVMDDALVFIRDPAAPLPSGAPPIPPAP